MKMKTKWRRITAALLAFVMIIASLPLSMVAYANDSAVGIGVINTAYSDAGDYNSYKVEFYKENGTKLNTIPAIDDIPGVSIDINGNFIIPRNGSVDLLSSTKIKNLIRNEGISEVRIIFRATEDGTNPKNYFLYSSTAPGSNCEHLTETVGEETSEIMSTVVYTIERKEPKLDQDGHPIVEAVYDEDGELDHYEVVMVDKPLRSEDFSLSEFVSTEIYEHEVDVHWHDTGVDRPDISNIAILQNGVPYEVNKTSDSPIHENSNLHVYKYEVPKYDSSGTAYTYTAGELTYTETNDNDYRLVSDGANNEFNFFSLRTFGCTINWHQGTNNPARHTAQQIKDYITSYFDLYDETDYEVDELGKPILDEHGNKKPKKLTIDPSRITIAGTTTTNPETGELIYTGSVQIQIDGLDEITADGKAKAYFLQRNDTAVPPANNEGDTWRITANNSGVHSSDITRVYQDAAIDNVITGTVEYSAHVNWKDSANQQSRENNADPGGVVLWRYANESGQDTAKDKERSAQTATGKLIQTDANGDPVLVDGKYVYLDKIEFNGLDKYDRFGNRYIYYVKEKLNSGLGSYDVVYTDGSGNSTDFAYNGGIITNNLAGTRNFVVEAEWKAAARQGGTASVTYTVQRWDGNDWVDVNHLTIDNFKAETMTQTGQFSPLPMYDANGQVITYRVVQTSVTRVDNGTQTRDQVIAEDTPTPSVVINGDTYDIDVVSHGDKYNFTYRLTGNMPMDIIKIWDDNSNPVNPKPNHASDTVQAEVKQFDFHSNEYRVYTDSTDSHYDSANKVFNIISSNEESVSGARRTWRIRLQVPMYDDEGHEYHYNVSEKNSFSNYDSRVAYSKPNGVDSYTITNTYGDDPGYTMVVKKEWQDDGDLLHRKAMDINYTGNINGTAGSKTVNDSNIWEEHISKQENYVYDSHDFTESKHGDNTTTYTELARKRNDYSMTVSFNNLPEGTYRVSQKNGEYKDNGNTVINWVTVQDNLTPNNNNAISVALTKKTKLLLEKMVTDPDDPSSTHDEWQTVTGLSNSAHATAPYIECISYAGSTPPTFTVGSDNTITISDYSGENVYTLLDGTTPVTGYEWIGDSLGKVLTRSYGDHPSVTHDLSASQLVRFPNLVAIYKDSDHYYAVEQVNRGDEYVEFTNTRIGVVSYKVELEWCMGDWVAQNAGKFVTVKISGNIDGKPESVEQEIPISSSVTEYYLTNLPKYDTEGKIIEWSIQEIKLAGIDITPGSCIINGNTCTATVTSPVYTYGTDSHSDDLISVKLTNSFSGTTSAEVNKMWFDDDNALGLRGDTYIQLWYKSTDPNSTEDWQQLGGDYVWTATEETEWHYRFSDLPKFDSNGYPYEYAIKELDIKDYITKTYDDDAGYHSGTTHNLAEDNQNDALIGSAVPSGGWFTDKLAGEVVIDGKKLWNNISSVLDHSHYPIANIELTRQNKYKTVRVNTYTVGKELFEQQGDSNEYVATYPIPINEAGTYTPAAVSQGLEVYPMSARKISANSHFTVTLTVTGQPDTDQEFTLTHDVQTDATDAFKIGQTSIYNGDSKFIFKPNTQWVDNDPSDTTSISHVHEIVDGYYLTNGNVPRTKTLGTVQSMILPKFDDKGALITYDLKEVPIQGYIFEISNDKIVNEYNGGRPVEITVTKKWENMDNVEYPSVKLVLHQIMFAKTMDQSGTDYVKDEHGKYVLTPIEYATYEKTLKKGDENCTGDTWTYVFGKLNNDGSRVNPKENIRQFAPDGSCFAYYITEELMNNDGEKVVLNALDNSGSSVFLGDFYKATEMYSAIQASESSGSTLYKYRTNEAPYVYVADDGMGFKVKEYTQPESIENELYDSSDPNYNESAKIQRYATIKNSYEPDVNNFKGKLTVSKTWENHDSSSENEQNGVDFQNVKDYTFKVSRLTKNIDEKDMFRVKTNGGDGVPEVKSLNDYFHFEFVKPMTPYASNGAVISSGDTTPVSYYEAILRLAKDSYSHLEAQEINIVIRVHKRRPTDANYTTMHNKVEIEGLAIYAQDAIRYTYKITEEFTDLLAYENSDNPQSGRMEDVTENNTTVTKKDFSLHNELKVFDLNLYKVFGKSYTHEGETVPRPNILSPSDYEQFFNESFVTNLQFELWRKAGEDGIYTKYNYKDTDGDTTDYIYAVSPVIEAGELRYKKVFSDLPKYSPDGELYYYQVKELGPTVNPARYFTLYTTNKDSVGRTEYVNVSSDDNTGNMNTYVRNVFEAKQINVNKYWDDNDNADGMRPSSVQVNISEDIPDNGVKNISKTLENGVNGYGRNWRIKVELPKYYYNGTTPVDGLTYGITEDMTPNGYKAPSYTYVTSKDGLLESKALANNEMVSVSENDHTELEALNVYNSKDPVNSKLTFDKKWDDLENKWSLRPDHIYVKIRRNVKDLVTIGKKGTFNIPGTMSVHVDAGDESPANDVMNVKIRNIPEGSYKVQQQQIIHQPDGSYVSNWVDIPFDKLKESGYDVNNGDNEDDWICSIEFTADVKNPDMVQMFRIVDIGTDPSGNKLLTKDKDDKDLVAIIEDAVSIGQKGNIAIPGNMSVHIDAEGSAPARDVMNVRIEKIPAGRYKVQQQRLVLQQDESYASYWVDIAFDMLKDPDYEVNEGTNENEWIYNIEFTADVENTDMVQMFRIVDIGTDPSGNMLLTKDKDDKDLVAIVNDNAADQVVTEDNSGYTLGVRDTGTKFYVSGSNITVHKEEAVDKQVGVLATGLDKYSDEEYTYHILSSVDDTFTSSSEITVTPNNTGRGTVSVSATNTGAADAYFRLTRSVGAGAQTNVTSGFRLTGGTVNLLTGIISVKAGESILIDELPKKCAYEYKVYDGATALDTEVRDTTDSEKVDVLAVVKNVTADKTLTINRSVNGGAEQTVVPESNTVYRFFAADGSTGTVALPVNKTTDVGGNADNPIVVFENLSYGQIVGSGADSTWKPYYYTTVECDKYGYDVDSMLTSSQQANDEAGDHTVPASVDLSFKINVTGYTDRKHINIKVERNGEIVKTDVNGKYLKITVDGVDFYASNSTNNTPEPGVIVIPVTSDKGYIECTVHDLPYAPESSGGYGTQFSYTVSRSKSNGSTHTSPLTFVPYEGNQDYSVKVNDTPATTDVTYTKTWTKAAVDAGLMPESIHLKLYCVYSGGSETEVTGYDYLSNVNVSGAAYDPVEDVYSFTDTIEGLPAGTVVNENGVGVWRKYTYFFKEYYDSALSEEKSGGTAYDPYAQTKGEDKPFILAADNQNASLEEGIRNTLTKTSHDVTKTWIDEDAQDFHNREDFYIVLERRAGIKGNWERVDLNNTIPEYIDDNNPVPEELDKAQTILNVPQSGGTPAYTMLKVHAGQLHIRFEDLPYCDKNGIPYQYRAAEVGIGGETVREDKTYLFLVPGTEPTDEDYSYVRIIRRGSNNYYVNYEYDDPDTHCEIEDHDYSSYSTEPTEITNEIVTNSVSFSHISVRKKWEDEDNLYGKRPERITYRLTRTKDGDPDGTFSSIKYANEANSWECHWDQLAAFAADGGRFEYFVEELPIANYTTAEPEETVTSQGGETTKVITFTNTYVPQKKTLTAEKLWEDDSDYYKLRPGNVTYELYCKYDVYSYTKVLDEKGKVIGRTYQKSNNGYDGPVYNTSISEDKNQSEVYKEILKAKRAADPSATVDPGIFKVELDANDNWKVDFSDLPAWINPTADDRFNGKAVEVTYYIVETFHNGDAKYKKIYNCEASQNNTAGTSKDSWVLEKGLVYDVEYSKNVDGIYTVPQSIVVDGKLRVLIRDLPVADDEGNKYTYKVTETNSNGSTVNTHALTAPDSTFVESTGLVTSKLTQDKTDLLITADNCIGSGNVYFKLECTKTVVHKKFVHKDDMIGVTFDQGLLNHNDNALGILSYTSAAAGSVSLRVDGLPKADGNGRVYTYSAAEYASDDPDEAVPLSLDDPARELRVTATAVNSSDPDKVDVTVTKNVATANHTFYFRIERSFSTVSNENSVLDNKKAQPFLLCAADEYPEYQAPNPDVAGDVSKTVDSVPVFVDDLTWNNFGIASSGDADYQKRVLMENDIICLTSGGENASLTIKGLPAKNEYGYDYQYSVVEYNGYSPSAAIVNNSTMAASAAADGNDASKVNVTVSKAGTSADQRIFFRLKRSVSYAQADGLGSFSVLKSEVPVGSETSVLNSLNTRNIVVALDWEDNDYLKDVEIDGGAHDGEDKINELHYNTEIRLSCDELAVTDQNDPNKKYSETKTITITNKNEVGGNCTYVTKYGVVFKDLPKYDKNGNPYEFDIEQKIGTSAPTDEVYKYQYADAYDDISGKSLLTDSSRKLGEDISESETEAPTRLDVLDGNSGTEGRKYDYGTTYTSYTDSPDTDYVTQYNILNTLPLTSVQVVKHWDDMGDKFGLRPAVPTGNAADPLGLDDPLGLEFKVSLDGNTWTDPDYMLPQTAAQRIAVDDEENTWIYTYQKLLRNSDQNELYRFKITEKLDDTETNVNGYKTPNYDETAGSSNAKQTITVDTALINNGNNDWDGTHPLTTTMDITNKLDTHDITVAKLWDDNGYGGDAGNDVAKSLHYDLALNLTGTIKGATAEDDTPLKWTVNNSKVDYSETYVLSKDAVDANDNNNPYAVKFLNLPKFDTDGKVIVYTVSESKNISGKTVASGDHLTTVIANAATDATADEFTAPADADRKYGYDGTCKKLEEGEAGKEYVTQYTITNTLPLTAIKANKHWDDDSNKFGFRPSAINDKNKGENATDAIDLTLLRMSGNGSYAAIENKAATILTHNTEWYDSTGQKKIPVDNTTDKDEWTYTYKKLLKYDADNNAYNFRINEAQVNGYKVPHYCAKSDYETDTVSKQTITAAEVNKPNTTASDPQLPWDGTHTLVQEFEITNKLDTRDIIVTKVWDDNDSADGRKLHYDIDVTLSSTQFDCTTAGRTDGEGHYTETRMIPRDYDEAHPDTPASSFDNAVIFRGLPRYDKTGAEIIYSVSETVAGNPSHWVAADLLKEAITDSSEVNNVVHEELTWTFPTNPVTTENAEVIWKDGGSLTLGENDHKYGYTGSWESYKAAAGEGETQDPCAVRFKLTNELPVVKFEGNLYWNDNLNHDGKRLEKADIVLSRDNWDYATEKPVTPATDNDYIYFSVPASGRNWTEGELDTSGIQMYLSDSTGSAEAVVIQPVSGFVDTSGNHIYRFPAPSEEYDTVYFKGTYTVTVGETQKTVENRTADIGLQDTSPDPADYRKGYVFTPLSVITGGDDNGRYNFTQSDYNTTPSQSYRSRGYAIEIDLNDETVADEVWDDPHIIFYDSDAQVIGSASYILTSEGGKYLIQVPVDAVGFKLTNGGSGTVHTTIDSDSLTPGRKYVLTKDGVYSFDSTENSDSAREMFIEKVSVVTLYENSADSTGSYWEGSFGIQPVYNENNQPYTYRISEKDGAKNTPTTAELEQVDYTYDYSPSVTMTKGSGKPTIHDIRDLDADDWTLENELIVDSLVSTTYTEAQGDELATVIFVVRNNHNPPPDTESGSDPEPDPGHSDEVGKIKLTKTWLGDSAYKSITRPSSLEFKLYCSYGDNEKVLVSEAEAILGSVMTDTYTVTPDADDPEKWELTIRRLPIYCNPTGTAVSAGQVYKINYYLVETAHNGYDNSGDDTAIQLTTNGATVTTEVTNTLKTASVRVKKTWDDSGYTATHYDVDSTLTLGSDVKTWTVPTIVNGDTTGQTVSGLPVYLSDGSLAQYNVTENTIKYGYVPTCSDENFTLTADGTKEVTITNTLPTTTLKVNKNWVDSSNTYKLRPADISLALDRATAADATSWETVAQTTPVTRTRTDVDANNWSITYDNLLKFDESNQPYLFKVTETVPNGYKTSNAVVTTTKTGDTVNYSVSLNNQLITGKVVLTKAWNDNGYGTSLHYPVEMEIVKAVDGTSVPQQIRFTGTVTTGASPSGNAEIEDVPVYDKAGNAIAYTARELNQQYGYEADEATKTMTASAPDANGIIGTVGFTNTLPVTYIKVTKEYVDDDTYHKYATSAGRDITFDLTRSISGGSDEAVQSNVAVSYAASPGMYWENSSPLLVYDQQNRQYTYKVAEQLLPGYTPSYSYSYTTGDPAETVTATDGTIPAESAASGTPLTLTLTNTQITGDAKFQKIDYTYYSTHKGEHGYHDKPIDGAVFELYIKDSNKQPVYVNVTPATDDQGKKYYKFDTTSSDHTVTSQTVGGVKGIIDIRGLPLNTYYLKEIRTGTLAYQLNEAELSFTVDVNATNEPSTSYTANTPMLNNGHTDIYDKSGFITHSGELAKVGDPETPRTLELTKVDALDNTPLENATYYLLYLIPYEINVYADGDDRTEAQYYSDATDTVKNSGGLYTADVAEYWTIEDVFQTDQNGEFSTPIEGLRHGTYTLMEVRAPIGYDIDNDGFDRVVYEKTDGSTENASELHILTLDDTYVSCEITHKDPRRDATVKIYKQDQYENPLNGAEFELWYDPVKLQPEPAQTRQTATITPRSDRDYIYFLDNKEFKNNTCLHYDYDGRWVQDPNNSDIGKPDSSGTYQAGDYKIYAQFYDSNDQMIPNDLEMWEKYANEEGLGVFKVQPPSNAKYVIFYPKGPRFITRPDWGNTAEDGWFYYHTVKIEFNLGEGYQVNSHDTFNGDNTGEQRVETWTLSTNTDHLNEATTPMVPTANRVVFHLNHTRTWDDLHICFYKDNGNGTYSVVGQSDPGYLMEPYGNGSHTNTFELTIPEGATHFRVNNGTKDQSGTHRCNYISEYTAIQTDGSKLYDGNFFEFTNASGESDTALTLKLWDTIPASSATTVYTANSDHEYIYFTCPEGWIDSQHPHLYAYFNGGGTLQEEGAGRTVYCAMPGVMDDSYFINSEGKRVYRFKAPSGFSYVKFNNGKDAYETDNITYTLGIGYSWNGTNLSGWSTQPFTAGTTNYTQIANIQTPSADSNYDDSYIYIVTNVSKTDGTRDSWDDIHVLFSSDAQGATSVLQASPGYIAEYIGTYTEDDRTEERSHYPAGDWYRIPVPETTSGAAYFTLNNGSASLKGTRAATSETYKLKQGCVYYFDDTNVDQTQNGKMPLRLIWDPSWASDPAAQDPSEPYEPFRIATVVTGDNGLNGYIKWLKPQTAENKVYAPNDASTYIANTVDTKYLVHTIADIGADKGVTELRVVKWGTYFWKEVKTPTGYTADVSDPINFEVGREEADKIVNVINARNVPIKGSVELAKKAQERVGSINIGDPVPGAVFNLYRKTESGWEKTAVDPGTGTGYIVNLTGSSYDMTTGSDGKLRVSELDWGQYYLVETSAPTGFAVNSKPVYFSVGRNNCETVQALTCKDTAGKAKMKLTKVIDKRTDAWGDPTFIFNIRQTERYDNAGALQTILDPAEQHVRTVSITLDGDKTTDSIGYFDIDPGTYVVSEVKVSRYELNSVTINENANVTDTSTNDLKATLTIGPDGVAEIVFNNDLKYYDKFSHVDARINHFDHSYKGIRVEYNEPISGNADDKAVISKTVSSFRLYRIMSDGEEVEITDADEKKALVLSYRYVSGSSDDPRFINDFTDNTEGGSFSIYNVSLYTDGVYKLMATDANGFTCDFEISFVSKNDLPKRYQKTFIFKADQANRAYFEVGGVKTSQYAFTFTMVDDVSNGYKVYCVKHNGEVIAQGSNMADAVNTALRAMNASLKINEAHAYDASGNPTGFEFDKWNDGTSDHTNDQITYAALETLAKAGSSPEEITYTAILKTHTSGP